MGWPVFAFSQVDGSFDVSDYEKFIGSCEIYGINSVAVAALS